MDQNSFAEMFITMLDTNDEQDTYVVFFDNDTAVNSCSSQDKAVIHNMLENFEVDYFVIDKVIYNEEAIVSTVVVHVFLR